MVDLLLLHLWGENPGTDPGFLFVFECEFRMSSSESKDPPLKRHALCVAAVSPLHGIPLITGWPSPENLHPHRRTASVYSFSSSCPFLNLHAKWNKITTENTSPEKQNPVSVPHFEYLRLAWLMTLPRGLQRSG